MLNTNCASEPSHFCGEAIQAFLEADRRSEFLSMIEGVTPVRYATDVLAMHAERSQMQVAIKTALGSEWEEVASIGSVKALAGLDIIAVVDTFDTTVAKWKIEAVAGRISEITDIGNPNRSYWQAIVKLGNKEVAVNLSSLVKEPFFFRTKQLGQFDAINGLNNIRVPVANRIVWNSDEWRRARELAKRNFEILLQNNPLTVEQFYRWQLQIVHGAHGFSGVEKLLIGRHLVLAYDGAFPDTFKVASSKANRFSIMYGQVVAVHEPATDGGRWLITIREHDGTLTTTSMFDPLALPTVLLK